MELLDRNTAALQGRLGAAIETMSEICVNAENAAQVRLNAADAIIRNSLKLTETNDILTRLEKLEMGMTGNE